MSFKTNFGSGIRPPPVRPLEPTSSAPATAADVSDSDPDETFHDARFPPEEEASLLAASNTTKSEANILFAQARYSEAISTYDRALGSCPNYLDYEIAVLKSNISACHLKLDEWKQAVESANAALEALDRIDPPPPPKKETAAAPDNNDVVELAEGEDEDDAAALEKLTLSDARKADISRIRAKALMRRARARSSLAGWADLAGAEEDYKLLASDPRLSSILPQSDMKAVRAGLRDLPPKIAAAKEKEMGEMMGKLKELGNGILKPFGLSTDNFKMVKDEKTGGYSMSFEQGGKK
jgi:tetratricopeptide (TPR) repeat protein